MRYLLKFVFIAVSLFSFSVFAADLPAPGKLTVGSVRVNSYLDTYYEYNFNHTPLSTDVAKLPQVDHHAYDRASRQFQLGQARVGLAHDAEPIGFDAQFGFGSAMDALNSTDGVVTNGFIRRATVNWASSGWSVDAGRFDANFGLEKIDAVDNWNYSRSFLFTLAEPKFFTGARAGYELTSGWKAHLGLANGADRFSDNNIAKTGMGGLAYASTDTWFNFNFAVGPENTSNSVDYRYSFNFNVKHNYSDTLATGFDSSFVTGNNEFVTKASGNTPGKQAKVRYFGGALYGAFSFWSDHWDSLRAEFFKDNDGAATLSGTGRNLMGFTYTHRASLSKNFSVWFEGRWDHASLTSFADTTGAANKKPDQITALVAATFAI